MAARKSLKNNVLELYRAENPWRTIVESLAKVTSNFSEADRILGKLWLPQNLEKPGLCAVTFISAGKAVSLRCN